MEEKYRQLPGGGFESESFKREMDEYHAKANKRRAEFFYSMLKDSMIDKPGLVRADHGVTLPPLKVFLGWTPMKEFISRCVPFKPSPKEELIIPWTINPELKRMMEESDRQFAETMREHSRRLMQICMKPRQSGYNRVYHYEDPVKKPEVKVVPLPTFTDWDKECELLKQYCAEKSDRFANALVETRKHFETFQTTGSLIIDMQDQFRYIWNDGYVNGLDINYSSFDYWKTNRNGMYRYFRSAYSGLTDDYGYKS